jgi:hypothetical protein
MNIISVPGKHVIGPTNQTIVEPDLSHRVQTLSHQLEVFVVGNLSIEFDLIDPIFFFDPLKIPFVGAPKWIRDQTIPKQVHVNAAGHLGGIPKAVMEQLPRTNERLKLARHKGLDRGTFEAAGFVVLTTRARRCP